MIYVFFSEIESWKSDELGVLKDFVKRHFRIETYWMKFEIGEKFIFSECGTMSLERCPSSFKCLHQIPKIGEKKEL